MIDDAVSAAIGRVLDGLQGYPPEPLLDEVNQLIDDRVRALAATVLDERPDWLDRLGPEPSNPTAREAWLDEIATTVAHHDRAGTAPPVDAPTPVPGLSR